MKKSELKKIIKETILEANIHKHGFTTVEWDFRKEYQNVYGNAIEALEVVYSVIEKMKSKKQAAVFMEIFKKVIRELSQIEEEIAKELKNGGGSK